MDSKMIKVKASNQWLTQLTAAYKEVISQYVPENEHEQLLLECAVAFHERIEKMSLRDQQKFTLNVTAVEAIAFMQLWQSRPVPLKHYMAVAVNQLVAKIDHKRADVKRMGNGQKRIA